MDITESTLYQLNNQSAYKADPMTPPDWNQAPAIEDIVEPVAEVITAPEVPQTDDPIETLEEVADILQPEPEEVVEEEPAVVDLKVAETIPESIKNPTPLDKLKLNAITTNGNISLNETNFNFHHAKENRVLARRIDGHNTGVPHTNPSRWHVYNKSLNFLLNNFESHSVIDDELSIYGDVIKSENCPGIWDENWVGVDAGAALAVTDSNGERITPLLLINTARYRDSVHTLLPVNVGNYLLLSGQYDGISLVTVYKVENITETTSNDKVYPRFNAKLIAYLQADDWNISCPEEIAFWTKDHPAIQESFDAIFNTERRGPVYACKYKEIRFHNEDYTAALEDQAFLAKFEEQESITAAYDQLDTVLGEAAKDGYRKNIILDVALRYVEANDVVEVYFLGLVYDFDTNSSAEGRLCYLGVALKDDEEVFWYPDRTKDDGAIKVSDFKNYLKENGIMICSFRRMVE